MANGALAMIAARPRSRHKPTWRSLSLRKPFIAAAAAALAVASAGVAYAQNPDPSITVTTSVSPTKAGTKKKPKSETLKLKVVNNPASKTTAKSIAITLPSTLKLSTKGLPQCTKSDQAILDNPSICKKSFAGSGTAHAVLNPNNPAPLSFKVQPVVGKNQMLFILSGSASAVLHGKVKGSTMTISITPQLQQPVPGTFSALSDLSTSISKKKGKAALVTSTGCKSKKHTIKVTVGYAPNPTAPSKPSATSTGDAKCS
jgi:hypothetical protein